MHRSLYCWNPGDRGWCRDLTSAETSKALMPLIRQPARPNGKIPGIKSHGGHRRPSRLDNKSWQLLWVWSALQWPLEDSVLLPAHNYLSFLPCLLWCALSSLCVKPFHQEWVCVCLTSFSFVSASIADGSLYGCWSGQFRSCSGMLITLTRDVEHSFRIETYLRMVHWHDVLWWGSNALLWKQNHFGFISSLPLFLQGDFTWIQSVWSTLKSIEQRASRIKD